MHNKKVGAQMENKILEKIFPNVVRSVKRLEEKVGDVESKLLSLEQKQEAYYRKMESYLQEKFENEHEVGKKRFEIIVDNINKRHVETREKIEKQEYKFANIEKKIDELLVKENFIEKHIEEKYLYSNMYERKVIQSFEDMYNQKDYRKEFLGLVAGLEMEDINKIVCILRRQREILENKDELDIFQDDEQKKIKEMIKSFKNEIYRVDDGLYVYRNYYLPVNHFEASVFYYKHGMDEVKNLQYICNKDIVDVGGFIGDSVLVLKPYTTQKIYTFEAVKENYNLLLKTIELNHLENVVAENLALGAENGILEMQVAGSASTSEKCHSTVYGTEKVSVIRFDDYVEKNKLNVGLIKIDIEGAEQSFLAGAKKTIISQKPILLCSIYHNADDFFHIKPILESWNVGYRYHIHKPVDFSVSREILLIAEPE